MTLKKAKRRLRKRKGRDAEEYDELEDRAIINEDFALEDKKDGNDNNPFVELRQLISSKDIDVKTLLSDKQVIINHKLNTLQHQFELMGDEDAKVCAEMLGHFTNRYMTLVINKEGLSRKQFIEALLKGGEKAEEARRLKLEDGLLKVV